MGSDRIGPVPEYELGLQIFTEAQAAGFPFDILDVTKLVPEELVPLLPVGKMVLNRNPDNFFAETEQVAFCTAHVVPGNDFTDDPLLQGRNHSYIDTQISRLGGSNFHEIPINSAVAQVHNNQRDGFHRQASNRGRINYEPNSPGGGCPFQAGQMGFNTFPQPVPTETKVRGKPELFGEYYGQARLFCESQSAPEQRHIVDAFRFEPTRVQVPDIRIRMLAGLVNVELALATAVADGLGMALPAPLPRATPLAIPAYAPSPSLSLLSRPGQRGIRTRRVAIVVGDGVDGEMVRALYASLLQDGAVPRLVGRRLGRVDAQGGCPLDVEITFEAGPSVLYDAVVVPDGCDASGALSMDANVLNFLREQYRHGKPLLVSAWVAIDLPDDSPDPGVIIVDSADSAAGLEAFKDMLAGHRVYARESDRPRV